MADGKLETPGLGRVRLQDETGTMLLVPRPLSDPNDPLNW